MDIVKLLELNLFGHFSHFFYIFFLQKTYKNFLRVTLTFQNGKNNRLNIVDQRFCYFFSTCGYLISISQWSDASLHPSPYLPWKFSHFIILCWKKLEGKSIINVVVYFQIYQSSLLLPADASVKFVKNYHPYYPSCFQFFTDL